MRQVASARSGLTPAEDRTTRAAVRTIIFGLVFALVGAIDATVNEKDRRAVQIQTAIGFVIGAVGWQAFSHWILH
jgi:hypothetical protein